MHLDELLLFPGAFCQSNIFERDREVFRLKCLDFVRNPEIRHHLTLKKIKLVFKLYTIKKELYALHPL